ncbi:Uma2 family endonuclease [Paractinoplanes atraurantiacus]|uniref:Endonuclease, Uma2 family (Restriction endonuclease fold) n=1 Tax=Paractinoplanes atraurantiacus TaxID=1036182 RepID=A0A285H623_9ACTN|nr:Uma2 family endonuclease [Actinoplanes atraurantiacus]SNY31212.1 Endonuclease, Uma2 family (restriction endonuclease fold) [Actinoplanes atraurantiacus]
MGLTSPASYTLAHWSAPEGEWSEPDLHLFPQDGHRYEIVDGSLHASPPPPESHEATVRGVVTSLRSSAPPGWWVCDRVGIQMGDSNLVPDVLVLRPRSSGSVWCDPADVALVVEIETPATQRFDRLLKPSLYAEAGIASFWRVEPGRATPLLHTYALAGDRYQAVHSVEGAEPVKLDAPYPMRIAPAAWL